MDPNTPITVVVAAYAQPLAAQQDFGFVRESIQDVSRRFSIALLGGGGAGSLRVIRHHSEPVNPAWGSALLAAALVLFVAPAGAGFLTAVPATGGAGAVASHLHRTVPRKERDLATGMLEEYDSGIVVIAADRTTTEVEALFDGAEAVLAMSTIWDGLDRAIEQEIADTQVNPSGT